MTNQQIVDNLPQSSELIEILQILYEKLRLSTAEEENLSVIIMSLRTLLTLTQNNQGCVLVFESFTDAHQTKQSAFKYLFQFINSHVRSFDTSLVDTKISQNDMDLPKQGVFQEILA